MKVASIFIYNPVSGWNPKDRQKYNEDYSCTEVFIERFCFDENMILVKTEVECLGGVMVIHLEMKSVFSVKHPDSNQAHYKAEVVMYTVY